MPTLLKTACAVIASLCFTFPSYRRRSLSFDGALHAAITGFSHFLVGVSPTVMLLSFFVSSSWLTKWKAETKKEIDSEYKEGGQRNWKQVFANSGLEVAVCCLYMYWFGEQESPIDFNARYYPSFLIALLIGGYAASNGDTWASEIGVISRGPVWLITTGRRVPRGTNGGISVLGTIASISGGIFIGFMHYLSTFILGDFSAVAYTQWPSILLGAFAGFTGSIVDSFLGATLEYSGFDEDTNKIVYQKSKKSKYISGRQILDGNQVNFLSIITAAFLSALIAPQIYNLNTLMYK